MKLLIIILTTTLLTIISCDTTDPKPPEVKPPGYQEDIPWPSLADSPWPMAHHDPQSSGRSKLNGPILGNKIWEYGTNNAFWAGITIGPDSTIYTVANDSNGISLYAFNPQGTVKFINPLTNLAIKNRTAPLVRSDGSIICYDGHSTIFAFNPDGSLLWKNESGYFTRDKSFNIDKNGLLYLMAEPNKLVVLNSTGELAWELIDNRISGFFSKAISFSPDGKTAYTSGNGVAIVAIDVELHQIKWTFEGLLTSTLILVDFGGNIYIETQSSSNQQKSNFLSIKPDGTLRWKYKNSIEPGGDNSPTIDKNGNIYFGADTLYSANYQGNLRWKIGLDGYCVAPNICDESGNIYLTTESNFTTVVYKITKEGTIIWSYRDDGSFATVGSPAIGFDNSMYIPITYGKLLSIK